MENEQQPDPQDGTLDGEPLADAPGVEVDTEGMGEGEGSEGGETDDNVDRGAE